MDFGLSLQVSEEAYGKAKIINRLSAAMHDFFRDKNYGSGIRDFTIGLICVQPAMDGFFKIRYNYVKSKGLLEYDVKLNHQKVTGSTQDMVTTEVRHQIISSVNAIKDKRITNFDFPLFLADLNIFFETYAGLERQP